MSQTFDDLMGKLKDCDNTDRENLRSLLAEINQAREDDKIDDEERNKLLASAKTLY